MCFKETAISFASWSARRQEEKTANRSKNDNALAYLSQTIFSTRKKLAEIKVSLEGAKSVEHRPNWVLLKVDGFQQSGLEK